MLDAAEAAIGFVAGRERGALDADRMLVFALVRAVEIIGEAASKVTPKTRAAFPAVPWSAVIAMRHRPIHAYFDIDRNILWKTANQEIPALVPVLRDILSTL